MYSQLSRVQSVFYTFFFLIVHADIHTLPGGLPRQLGMAMTLPSETLSCSIPCLQTTEWWLVNITKFAQSGNPTGMEIIMDTLP